MELSKTQLQFPLSSKKIIKKTIVNSIIFIILGIVGLFSLVAVSLTGISATTSYVLPLIILNILGILVLILLVYFYQKWYFNTYFYDLGADFIIIRKGPITPREITIPYERVQDVYVDQDLFDRFFKLYDVHLSSATSTSGMEAHIDGVEKNSADGLRTILLETINQRISRKSNSQPQNFPQTNITNGQPNIS